MKKNTVDNHRRHPDEGVADRLIWRALEEVNATNRPTNLHIGPLVMHIRPGDYGKRLFGEWSIQAYRMYIPKRQEHPDAVASAIIARANEINEQVIAEIPQKVRMYANPGEQATIVSLGSGIILRDLGILPEHIERRLYF